MSLSQAHLAFWTLLLTLIVGAPAPSHAQTASSAETSIRFDRLDGLSHNTVTSILQDHQGFLWIGTSDGLNRYDGYDFIVYRHDRLDSTSLSNNSVKTLLGDRDGALWIGTDGGLDRFDRRTERFVRYVLAPGVSRQAVLQLLEDHAGRLWAGSDGLHRYDPAADRFVAYRHDPDDPNSLAGNYVWSLFEGRDGTLWIGTDGHTLHRHDARGDHFVRLTLPETWSHPVIVHQDEANRLWLANPLGESSAFAYANDTFTALTDVPLDRLIRVVLDDRRGIRWIGTDDGLYRIDPTTHEQVHARLDPAPGAYLQNNVTSLYEDQAGTLWVGAFSGLYRLDPRAKPFRHLRHDPTDPNSLSNNTVMAVWEEADSVLWIGTLGGGLNRFNRHTGALVRFQRRPELSNSLCNDLIWALHEDRRGTLWIGTDQGLCAFDRRTGRFTAYPLPLDAGKTAQPPINAIRADQAGRLWIASNIGLYRLDPTTGNVRWYARPGDDAPSLSMNFFVQSLHLDRAGFLWIGVFGGILYRFDPEMERFARYPLLLSDDAELISEGIWAIHEARDSTFWLGSDLGLTHFDPRSGAARHFTGRDGLPASIVYAILQDDLLGRLWLSTNHGLVRFDERLSEGRKVRVYDAGDGLGNTEFNRRAAFTGRDGTFYFGGLGGLTWFHPTALQDNLVVPPVAITRIETSNRDTTRVVNPHGLEELVLSYRDYTVSFEFAALNFTNSSKNLYRYRLEGFDEGWIEAGTRRYVRYTSIPPGSYVFRVIGSNNDGRWNEEGATLKVRVLPPFWQTWWFRLLVLGAVAGLLTAGYRYRVARLLEVERMRLRIAGDLHDDIGSNLSSIALLSDIVRAREHLGERERRQLSKISRSARAMVDALRDIVWSIDPDSDRPDDLIRRMQDTAASLLGDTRWTFQRPPHGLAARLDMDVRRHVFLGYKEMLHNVARHARATEVTIRLDEDRGHLQLMVADDGVGFDVAAPSAGNGLKHLQERAARINGRLTITSRPGAGTTILFVVPRTSGTHKTA